MTGDPTTLQTLADVAQVILGLGAIVSIWIGISSLREARRERAERIKPRLAFDHGGQGVKYEDKLAAGVPGLNPAYVKALVGPGAREVRMPTSRWGRLKNHGGGVALDADITFITREATVGKETFKVDGEKLRAFPYMPSVNRVPTSPTHVHPGEEGEFMRIPTPIYERAGNREKISGVVVIQCRDILDRQHFRFQDFHARVEKPPYGVLLSFGEEMNRDEARDALGALANLTPGLDGPHGRLRRLVKWRRKPRAS